MDLPETPGRLVALGAAAGLAVMAATSSGDALVAGLLLGLAAAEVAAGAIGVLVAVSVAGRWGLTSLVALAGGQAVVGAAGFSGAPAMVASSWAAAVAVVLACPRRSGAKGGSLPGVVACGLLAAALVAGPAGGWSTSSVVALRVVASVLAVLATLVVARVLPQRAARALGLAAAAAAAAAALLA